MSLDFRVTDIENYEQVCHDGDKWSVITQILVHECMWLKMQTITEDNWQEFYIRQTMWDACFGGIVIDHGENRSPTIDEIKSHIGLWTNVTQETRAGFRKHFVKQWEQHVEYQVRQEIEALEQEAENAG